MKVVALINSIYFELLSLLFTGYCSTILARKLNDCCNYWTPDFREFALKGNQLNRLQNIVLLLSLGLVQKT